MIVREVCFQRIVYTLSVICDGIQNLFSFQIMLTHPFIQFYPLVCYLPSATFLYVRSVTFPIFQQSNFFFVQIFIRSAIQ